MTVAGGDVVTAEVLVACAVTVFVLVDASPVRARTDECGQRCRASKYALSLWPSVRPQRDPQRVPTTTVVRPKATAPPIGVRFGFSDGGRTFIGIVVAVRSLSRTHVSVEVEVSADDYARLLGTDATH